MGSKAKKFCEAPDDEIIPSEYLALCPLDGRYNEIAKELAPYFSEYALMKNRTKVEVYWLKYLLENADSCSPILKNFNKDKIPEILSIYENFSCKSMKRIKEFENGSETTPATRHDVKSVEFFVDEKLKEIGFDELISFVHIGCTSEDINNASYANMIKGGINDVWVPAAESLIEKLTAFGEKCLSLPMLAHTHGQPATPTTMGKEIGIYVKRLQEQLDIIKNLKFYAKFNGATGNYAAIMTAFPFENWENHSKNFIENYLGLDFNPTTTQIESHDYICRLADNIRHFNNIVQGLDKDIWTYISMQYLKQVPVKNEVGSSTMPHKINPIKFENSEANINISNALLEVLSRTLSQSRMQRDLTDSSSQRNIGMALGYSVQAIYQTLSGLSKIAVNEKKLKEELNEKWEVLAEAIQTVLRAYGVQDAYNKLKDLTRGTEITKEALLHFVDGLDIPENARETLRNLTPEKYIGNAEKLAKDVFDKQKISNNQNR